MGDKSLAIKMKKKKKRVSFWATKKVSRKTRVSFRTSYGERVSFTATKKVPKTVKVSFWASSMGKKIKRRKK